LEKEGGLFGLGLNFAILDSDVAIVKGRIGAVGQSSLARATFHDALGHCDAAPSVQKTNPRLRFPRCLGFHLSVRSTPTNAALMVGLVKHPFHCTLTLIQ